MKNSIKKILLLIFVFMLTQLLLAAPSGWINYSDKQGRFEISFPGQPLVDYKKNSDPEINVSENLRIFQMDNGGSYELDVIVYRELLPTVNNLAKEFTDKIIKGYIGYQEGITSVTDDKFNELPCITYMIANKPTPAYFYKHKFIFVGNTLYHLIINYSLSSPNRGSVSWFINSLDIKNK